MLTKCMLMHTTAVTLHGNNERGLCSQHQREYHQDCTGFLPGILCLALLPTHAVLIMPLCACFLNWVSPRENHRGSYGPMPSPRGMSRGVHKP